MRLRLQPIGFCFGLCLLIIGGAFATPAYAQSQTVCTVSPCHVQANKPIQAGADHDGTDTDSYRLYVNGQVAQTLPVSSLQAGVIAFNLTLPRGTFVIYIEAVGEGGAAGSPSLTVVSVPGKPKPPTNTRVISQQ
jgi:hypothetical protein